MLESTLGDYIASRDYCATRHAESKGLAVLLDLVSKGADMEALLARIDPNHESLLAFLKHRTLMHDHARIDDAFCGNSTSNAIHTIMTCRGMTPTTVFDAICHVYSPLLTTLAQFSVATL